jgi:NAD+ synthase (glutamine-hydrolysing)
MLNLPSKPWRERKSEREILRDALLYGTRSFLGQTGITKVVIGASGGIDSALGAALYAEVLEKPEDLVLVNMPTSFNTETTKKAAADLARNLGCLYAEVPIGESVDLTRRQLDGLRLESSLGESQEMSLAPLVLENIQARDRSGRILAAVAAGIGGAFTCNANKSETTVGYSTLYGDHAGFLANLADLWKGQVYDQARLVNELAGREVIPKAIFEVLPSAELSDAQNPEEGFGDPFCYPYHDALFRSWVEHWERKSPVEILEAHMKGELSELLQIEGEVIDGLFDSREAFVEDLERWWRAYNGMGLAKRIQAPPILAVSRRAFGFDHRESQSRVLFTRRYQEMKKAFLA